MKRDPSSESTSQVSMPHSRIANRNSGPQNGTSGKSLYAITVTFELAAGAFETFQRLVSENARESVASEAGCLRFDVLTSPERPDEVFLYEIYTDRQAFDVHLASPHFLHFDEATRDLVVRKTVLAFSVEENAKSDLPAAAVLRSS